MYDDRQTLGTNLGAKKLPGLSASGTNQTMNVEANNGNTGVAPKDSASTGNTDPNQAQSEIGRAQKAYQEYKAQGRDDLAQNAHDYAQSQRDLYTSSGNNASNVDASKDLTSMYKGNVAGAYDVNKPGEQVVTQAQAPATQSRPGMAPQMSWNQAMTQSSAQYDPLRAQSMRQLDNQNYADKISADQIATARQLGHSGLQADALNKVNIGTATAKTNANTQYDSQIAQLANQIQQQDKNFNLQKWMADNNNYNSDRGFNYQVGRDQVGDNRYQQQFDYNKAVTDAGLTGKYNGADTFAKQQWDASNTLATKSFDLNQALSVAGLTGIYNGADTMQKKQIDDAMKLQWANYKLAQEQADNSSSLGWAQYRQSGNQWQQQFNQSKDLNNKDMMLNKYNMIEKLNNMSTDKASQYLQAFGDMGMFTPAEVSNFKNYWQSGQRVPSDYATPAGPPIPGK